MSLKDQITADMKDAMRARESERLGVIRLLQAAIKQREVDERIELDDTAVLAVIEKMIKQRRESIQQYTAAGRHELADQEAAEIAILEPYLPEQLGADEIAEAVKAAIGETGAADMKDMGKVMAVLKPKLQGKADMGQVSAQVKAQLSS